MIVVALLLNVALLVVASLHLMWALGVWFPIRDEERLVAMVVGLRGETRMPGPIPCALVVAGLTIAAGLPWIADGPIKQAGLIVAATVFLVRGILPFRPFWRKLTPQEPFATLDRKLYGPLCLVFSAGFALIAWKGI
ncbi:DUF3995 domain-containing protein [Flavimaricola marinus]|uniref:DUF3995 domain-containing protein n=1 Tax=Flavimaricola marinus TaxID=1819565 RepID=A0A238L900_9RHOB|nr:DUF3995 domain-containing protein [Flavimaricola marinus]SMY05884.1 hypothetical protein LOM8899_00005 [Flavimaricola marinus]